MGVLGVSARIRDEVASVMAILRIVAVVDGIGGAPILFRGFSIVGLPWHLGLCRMRRMFLGLQPGRSRQGLNVVLGPRSANRVTSTTPDEGISTEANERFVLHDHEIDTPTLSRECSQPSPQSVKNPPTRRHQP